MSVVVAIDGPSASGKSTVSKGVAARLGFLYVDSGSFYRGLTWRMLRDGVKVEEPDAVAAAADRVRFDVFVDGGAIGFGLDGERPVAELRTVEVDHAVSPVSAVPAARAKVLGCLRGMTEFGDLVMEGRDIGTVVFPDTPLKFYLTASEAERARRRCAERQGRAELATEDQVGEALKRRDAIDSTRAAAPLKVAGDARLIDSTGLVADEVVGLIVEAVRSGSPV